VVVVAFHSPHLLDHCLDDLSDGFDVVVVDNSSDARVAGVAARHGATYVDPGRNLGFGAGVNLGCTGRDGRDVLLLNPDRGDGGVRVEQ
jgi:GT2 family glycosyltransferase